MMDGVWEDDGWGSNFYIYNILLKLMAKIQGKSM